jgi:hypothetical protein
MAWIAEVFRKKHRLCETCRLGPTHLYGAHPTDDDPLPQAEPMDDGTPLCSACLAVRLTADLDGYNGRGLLFEPAFGPSSFVFHPFATLEAADCTPPDLAAAREALERVRGGCETCSRPARFLWIPASPDACLWGGEWLEGLRDGTLVPAGTLCGACAALRLARSIDERGLYYDAIVPPGRHDGVMLCTD